MPREIQQWEVCDQPVGTEHTKRYSISGVHNWILDREDIRDSGRLRTVQGARCNFCRALCPEEHRAVVVQRIEEMMRLAKTGRIEIDDRRAAADQRRAQRKAIQKALG